MTKHRDLATPIPPTPADLAFVEQLGLLARASVPAAAQPGPRRPRWGAAVAAAAAVTVVAAGGAVAAGLLGDRDSEPTQQTPATPPASVSTSTDPDDRGEPSDGDDVRRHPHHRATRGEEGDQPGGAPLGQDPEVSDDPVPTQGDDQPQDDGPDDQGEDQGPDDQGEDQQEPDGQDQQGSPDDGSDADVPDGQDGQDEPDGGTEDAPVPSTDGGDGGSGEDPSSGSSDDGNDSGEQAPS
ncbi:MAG TPA: hypothetical protein VNS55_10470 [Nocardioides sp.]|nr:hypothetical protein [Nocardioides sp.]